MPAVGLLRYTSTTTKGGESKSRTEMGIASTSSREMPLIRDENGDSKYVMVLFTRPPALTQESVTIACRGIGDNSFLIYRAS